MKRKNQGNAAIKLILLILLIILVVFCVYEIVWEDIFGIMEKESTPLSSITELKNQIITSHKEENKTTEVIEPILNNNQQSSEPVKTNIASHYYYNQLDDSGKIIYKAIEENIENMQTGTYQINFGTQFNNLLDLDTKEGEEKLSNAFQSAWNAYSYDYVDIFYIDVTKLTLTTQTTKFGSFSNHKVNLSNGDNQNYLTSDFPSQEKVLEGKKYIENVKRQIVEKLQAYSEYEKIKYLHNWLVDNLSYDTSYTGRNIHNVYGALKNTKVVCEGYARTFKYLLDGLGIPCVLVSGTATNSNGETESHAWNYVQLEEKWYAVDVTWDDPILTGGGTLTNDLRYKYFLKGSEYFFENHIEDGYISSKGIKFIFPTIEKQEYEK